MSPHSRFGVFKSSFDSETTQRHEKAVMSSKTVIVVGGPAGTGKSTMASLLAQHYECPFIEGDALHPKANIEKMAKGIPLTDEDRWGWLKSVSEISTEKAMLDESDVAVVSCSMLKKIYRDYIKKCCGNILPDITIRFIFLYTSIEDLYSRVSHRRQHFMKSDMVKSQYNIMEIPREEELISKGGDALAVNTEKKLPDQILKYILQNIDL